MDALRLIFGDKVERIAITAEEYKQHGRRVIVKQGPLPPRSFEKPGTGRYVFRRLGVGDKGIDTFRRGHGAAPRIIQVLATTHSWDCVRGFAQAATDDEDAEGILFRLERERRRLASILF